MAISKTNMSKRAEELNKNTQSLSRGSDAFSMLDRAGMLAGTSPFAERKGEPVPQVIAPSISATPVPFAAATSPNAPSQTIHVPLELIDENPFNARRHYRPERVNELVVSIGAHGQETPGAATPRDGRYLLVAGHYRLKALRKLNAPSMEIKVHHGLSDAQIYEMSFRENAERESQSALDNALAWDDLLKKGVYANETAIAEATGQSLSTINRTMSALKLSPATLEVIKLDPAAFGSSVLYELVQFEAMAGAERAAAMAVAVAKGEMSRAGLQRAREGFKKAPPIRDRRTSRAHEIVINGQVSGALKDSDSGKVTLEVTIEDPKARAELVAMLKDRFGIVH